MTFTEEQKIRLSSLNPSHPFFIGIDSDGCVFDSMELKHQECFIPATIRVWGLQSISKYVRETMLFVNLQSKWRGINRWRALIKVFDLLKERPEVARRGITIPEINGIRQFVESGLILSDNGLKEFKKNHHDQDLDQALEWTTSVNESIKSMVVGMKPFPLVKECLLMMENDVDKVCVSASPAKDLEREWASGKIDHLVSRICGQELGSKQDILEIAAVGKYPNERILLMGDAPGDLKAARASKISFYPVLPGQEEACWERFMNESYARFLQGTYTGAYEDQLIEEFERLLSDAPNWKK